MKIIEGKVLLEIKPQEPENKVLGGIVMPSEYSKSGKFEKGTVILANTPGLDIKEGDTVIIQRGSGQEFSLPTEIGRKEGKVRLISQCEIILIY